MATVTGSQLLRRFNLFCPEICDVWRYEGLQKAYIKTDVSRWKRDICNRNIFFYIKEENKNFLILLIKHYLKINV